MRCVCGLAFEVLPSSSMHMTFRKKLIGCCLVLLVCLWVIFKTSELALQYDKLVSALEWEVERCVHKQGLDPKGRLGPPEVYTHYSITGYPESLHSVGPAVFEHSPRQFFTRAHPDHRGETTRLLRSLLWPVSLTSDPWPVCTFYYDEAFVFTVTTPTESDWYYRLHVSTFLPLYTLLSYRGHFGPHTSGDYSILLMPAVEDYELQMLDWTSDVFREEQQFGVMQGMLRTFAGGMKTTPLTTNFLHTGQIICFMTVHFGVGVVNVSDPSLLSSFARLMASRLSLPDTIPTQPFVCLARRSLTRRLLNANELVEAVTDLVRVQVVEFEGLSYREQVAQMQRYTILVGFYGDELLNAIYMPKDSVTIQLLPFNSEGLQPTKYSEIVRAHGPYLEWTNPIEENSRPGKGLTSDQADTVVDVKEFVQLVKQALSLGINSRWHT